MCTVTLSSSFIDPSFSLNTSTTANNSRQYTNRRQLYVICFAFLLRINCFSPLPWPPPQILYHVSYLLFGCIYNCCVLSHIGRKSSRQMNQTQVSFISINALNCDNQKTGAYNNNVSSGSSRANASTTKVPSLYCLFFILSLSCFTEKWNVKWRDANMTISESSVMRPACSSAWV